MLAIPLRDRPGIVRLQSRINTDNLEKERPRNVQELARIEKAHNKSISGFIREMAYELEGARTDVKKTPCSSLSEYAASSSLKNPYRKIAETQNIMQDLNKRIEAIQLSICQMDQKDKEGLKDKLKI